MLPPARDPRMDREPARPQAGWSVVVVPDQGDGSVREYTLSRAQLRQLRWLVGGLLGLVAVLVVALGLTLPRSAAYSSLIDENLSLRGHVEELDQRMTEVDRLLLRLRLYDAQLRSLVEPGGAHGPLPDDILANDSLAEARERIAHADLSAITTPTGPTSLRPAEAWAAAVLARADNFVTLFTEEEPDWDELITELEDLEALNQALPSIWPAKGQLTSGFGWRRSPIIGSTVHHHGLDIANGRGTPIFSVAPGRVINAEWSGGYGRMVEIDHGFGITTVYAHCHRLRVREGDWVQSGDLIATMGMTGQVTGTHLHFEVRIDGHAVDPIDYLPR